MSVYILLSKLTTEGRKTIKERPARIKEVGVEIEKSGVKVIEQYATLGPYDFVSVIEAPDNETVSELSVDLCARGTIEIMSLAAVPVDSYVEALTAAKKIK
ncbi:MAG: GYD domain-containing protein [Thermodesulfobacteriota bacterium]